MSETVYILGIVLQAAAGIMALFQVRHAPRRLPWLLIAISSLLIVFRRSATLGEFMQDERELASAEVLTLIISFLFFLGVLLMTRMFRDLREGRSALEESQEKIRMQEVKFRTIAEFTADWEYWQDPEGKLVYVSPACEKVTGYSADMFMQDPGLMMRIIHPEDKESMACFNFEQHKPVEGVHVEADLRIITRTREIRWISHHCQAVYSSEGRFLGRRGSNRDTTRRKLAEEEIRNINQQLQKANAEKDMLFSIIGHDLKSPMSGILDSSAILANEFESLSRDDCQALFAALHDSSRNVMALLEDLLRWSHMSRGGMDYAPNPCSLNELVNAVFLTAQDMANGKIIAMRNEINADLTVLVDRPMIKTVIRNILFNALKFTPRGGEIVITANQAGQNVTVAIQDNGMGMNRQVLSSIFTMEKGKRRLGTEGEKGTGLGLILCKQFIEKHGGQIWVESEPGQGTTVYFTLPAGD